MIFPSEKSSQAENAVFLSNLVQNKRNEKRYTIPLYAIPYEKNNFYTELYTYSLKYCLCLRSK